MDISDEELFDATPSCSTSTTNTSLNLTEQTNNLTPDSVQEKKSNNVMTVRDILIKLTRLPNSKVKKRQTDSHLVKKIRKRRYWKFGNVERKRERDKRREREQKRASSFIPSRSLQQLQNMKPATETTSVPSEDRENEKPRTYNQSYKEESASDQEDEQAAQRKTESLVLTCQAQKEEDSYADKTYVCARTLPYKFYREGGRISDNGTVVKSTASSFSLASNSKNTEDLNNSSYLSNCPSSSDVKTKKKLIHSRLKFMAKRKSNEWKFKRKYVSSDSEIEEIPVSRKRLRTMSSNDSDSEDTSVKCSVKVIEHNNRSESHLSLEKTAKKKTDIQINRTTRVILTRLEEMEDEDVIKWRESKTKSSDVIVEVEVPVEVPVEEPVEISVEEQQLDRRKPSQNLGTLESQNKLILPEKNRFLETKDTPLSTTLSRAEKHSAKKSNLYKLKQKYKLFKKPRVLMIKLDTLQCFSQHIFGTYSVTEVERLTKNYVINCLHKSRGKKNVRLQKAYTIWKNVGAENVAEDNTSSDTSSSVSRKQNTNEITNLNQNKFEPEESSIKGIILFKMILLNLIFL